jgi:hypothetical protein
METFTMSRKELPRPGLMKTLLTGRITNQQAAAALQGGWPWQVASVALT